jgi:hypothetical protein
MKRYQGVFVGRGDPDIRVANEGEPSSVVSWRLDPRYDLANHSPDGFSWGYLGSGPAQASIAILADCLDARTAVWHGHEFMRKVIGRLPMEESWELTESQVRAHVAELEAQRPMPRDE